MTGCGSQPALTGNHGHGSVNLRPVHGEVALYAVKQDPSEAAVTVIAKCDARDQGDETVNVLGRHTIGEGQRRDCAVQETGVDKPEAKPA